MLNFRMKLPTGVTRGSCLILNTGPEASFQVHKQMFLVFSVGTHAAKFIAPEVTPALPDAHLLEENRPTRCELDQQRGQQKHWREDHKETERQDNIKEALDGGVRNRLERKQRVRVIALESVLKGGCILIKQSRLRLD